MALNHSKRRSDPLAMQIYAALLGGAPKVAKTPPPPHSRLKFDVRLETISSGLFSPFHTPGIKESIERAAAGAINALGEASERLRRTRTGVSKHTGADTPASPTSPDRPTPIVLIGPAAVRVSERIQRRPETLSEKHDNARRSAAA